jgi:hypothetical protein
MKRIVFLIAALLPLVPEGSPAQQVSSQPSISLAPAVVELHVKPGQTVTQTITLTNGTTQAFGYTMSAQDVTVRGGKRVFVPAGELPGSIAASAVFSRRAGQVGPLSQASVQVLLTFPKRTKLRGVVVFFRNRDIVAPRGGVLLNASLGALITFVASDDFALEARPFVVHPATAAQNLRVTDLLTNTGSEPVVPQGVAAFVDASGALVAKVPFTPARLMPGERSIFSAEYAGRLKPGRYRVICTYSYAGRSQTLEESYLVR